VSDHEVLEPRWVLRAFSVFEYTWSLVMVLIKVQYDAYNRQFKLCDRQLANTLTDGETYLLIADLSVDDPALTEDVQSSAETQRVVA
jgi:hypothetical protein